MSETNETALNSETALWRRRALRAEGAVFHALSLNPTMHFPYGHMQRDGARPELAYELVRRLHEHFGHVYPDLVTRYAHQRTAVYQLAELKPLAAVITKALRDTPIRLGSNDWADSLSAELVVRIAAYMGKTLGPDAPILGEIQAERERQDAQFGEQNHDDGTGYALDRNAANHARNACQYAASKGVVTWRDILWEEVAEALAKRIAELTATTTAGSNR